MLDLHTSPDHLARPNLMPNQVWARALTTDEYTAIGTWEQKYLAARSIFERYEPSAKGSYDQFRGAIAPDQYLRWLREATYRYTERNTERFPHLGREHTITKTVLAACGYVQHPPRHGEVALTVAPHRTRVRGDNRGRVTDGDRVHLHHTPKFEHISGKVRYGNAISVGIGDALHQRLHRARDSKRPSETLAEQVHGDFDFIRPHMLARGYTPEEVWEARQAAHILNIELGLYSQKEAMGR